MTIHTYIHLCGIIGRQVCVVQPQFGSVSSSAAHSDEALVSEALGAFGGGVEGVKKEEKGDEDDDEKSSAPSKSKRDRKRTTYCGMETRVTGVLRSDTTDHLVIDLSTLLFFFSFIFHIFLSLPFRLFRIFYGPRGTYLLWYELFFLCVPGLPRSRSTYKK